MKTVEEIALNVGLEVFEKHPYDDGHVVSPDGYTWIVDKLIEFAESSISAYKAELLKEVGEPLCYLYKDHDGSYRQAHDLRFKQVHTPVFTSDQVAAAVAKAEQRVAEACAAWCEDRMNNYEAGGFIREFTAARTAKNAIRSGEWRKFVKET